MPKPWRCLYMAVFTAIYCTLYLVYSVVPDGFLRDKVYYYGIVRPSIGLINWTAPAEQVTGVHNRLQSHGVILDIVRGCDGAAVIFLVVAAILAYRATVRATLLGIAGGCALIYALNQLRIVALYFILAHRPDWFTPMHVYFIPSFLILAGTIYFALWAAARDRPPQHALAR